MKVKLFTLLTLIFTSIAFSQNHTIVPNALENDYVGSANSLGTNSFLC